MSNICNDNRFKIIEKYKKELIEATNIEDSPEEMAVIDNILFRFWQMGWLEAIPIKWIKRYAKKGGRIANILFPFEIEMMLEDWIKENESKATIL